MSNELSIFKSNSKIISQSFLETNFFVGLGGFGLCGIRNGSQKNESKKILVGK